MTKWGFPTGPLHKLATQQMAVCDLLSYKYNKHPMWNRCIAIHIKTSSLSPFRVSFGAAAAAALQRPHGSSDGWLWPGRGLPIFRDRSGLCRGKEEGGGGSRCLGRCPSGPAVTGLSQPRGKVTHWTAQWGAINVRPGPSTMVMADKWLTGSSRSQRDTRTHTALRYVQSGGKTPASFLFYKPPESHARTVPLSYEAFSTLKDSVFLVDNTKTLMSVIYIYTYSPIAKM